MAINGPSRGFSSSDKNHYTNIHRHCWTESLKICKFTKFKGQASKASIPQNHKVAKLYRRLYGRVAGAGGGGNLTCCPPKIETFETFPEFAKLPYICVSFQQIIFKLGNFTDFKAFFPAFLRIFSDRVSHEKAIHTTKEQLADFYFNPFIFVGFVACVAAGPRTRLNHLQGFRRLQKHESIQVPIF